MMDLIMWLISLFGVIVGVLMGVIVLDIKEIIKTDIISRLNIWFKRLCYGNDYKVDTSNIFIIERSLEQIQFIIIW